MSCLSGSGSAQKKQKLSRPGSPNEQQNGYPFPQNSNHHSHHHSPAAGSNMSNSAATHYVNGYAHSNHSNGVECSGVNNAMDYTRSNGQLPGGSSAQLLSHARVPNNHLSPQGHNYDSPSRKLQTQTLPDFPPGNNVSSYDMCCFCFDLLINRLKPEDVPRVAPPGFSYSNDSFPLFVTWQRQESDGKTVLRGCIGTFTDTKLHKGLHDYALSSALKDSRFNPICAEEIPRLKVSVSLLLNFEAADSWDDWVIGVHGLRLEIDTDRGQKKTATYLPEVASEQHWTKKQTIDSLLQKSGFSGRINSEVRNRIRLTRYKSEKVTLSYTDYRARRANGSSPRHESADHSLSNHGHSSSSRSNSGSGGYRRSGSTSSSH